MTTENRKQDSRYGQFEKRDSYTINNNETLRKIKQQVEQIKQQQNNNQNG